MAVTVSHYNHTRKRFLNQEIELGSLKVMLLTGHVFDATDTDISAIDPDEVSGGGWPAGGEPIGGVTASITNTNEAKLDATDVSVNATGVQIGPATAAVIYQDVSGLAFPLWHIDFGQALLAEVGAPFRILWDALGIGQWINP